MGVTTRALGTKRHEILSLACASRESHLQHVLYASGKRWWATQDQGKVGCGPVRVSDIAGGSLTPLPQTQHCSTGPGLSIGDRGWRDDILRLTARYMNTAIRVRAGRKGHAIKQYCAKAH